MKSRRMGLAALAASLVFVVAASAAETVAAPAANEKESAPAGTAAPGKNPVVEVKTSLGSFDVELFADKAPATVKNFLSYAQSGFYDGTVFHRVIRDFMIQGGGMTRELQQKPTNPPVKNEADNGLKNTLGMVSMARTSAPDSATSQFFVNTKDNAFLDHRGKTPTGWGYAVFGKVVSGLDVVRKIEAVETTSKGGLQDVPKNQVVIESVKLRK